MFMKHFKQKNLEKKLCEETIKKTRWKKGNIQKRKAGVRTHFKEKG